MAYKDLKNQLYNNLPKTTTVTKSFTQNGVKDFTLNPTYKGPVYDPIGIVTRNAVRQENYIRQQKEFYEKQQQEQLKQAARNNSLADVFWDILDVSDDDIPILSPFAEYFSTLKDSIYNPNQGLTWSKFGLTLLNGAIEDLDILANPIKALVAPGYMLSENENNINWDGFKRLKYATFGDENGIRHNYNIDIDPKSYSDGLMNMVLETALDPINWVTLGAKSMVTKEVKTALNMSNFADDAVQATTEIMLKNQDNIIKKLSSRVFKKNIANIADDSAETIFKAVVQDASQKAMKSTVSTVIEDTTKGLAKHTASEAGEQITKNSIKTYEQLIDVYSQHFINNVSKTIMDGQTSNMIKSLMTDSLFTLKTDIAKASAEQLSMNVLKGVKGFYKFATGLDKGVFKVAAWNSGAAPVWLLTKAAVPTRAKNAIARVANKALQNAFERGYKFIDNFANIAEYWKYVKDSFENNPSLKTVLEAAEEGSADINFNRVLTYLINSNISNTISVIKNLNIEDAIADKNLLNNTIKRLYGFNTVDEFLAMIKTVPEEVLTQTKENITEFINVYNNFAKEVNIQSREQKIANKAAIGNTLIKINDNIARNSQSTLKNNITALIQNEVVLNATDNIANRTARINLAIEDIKANVNNIIATYSKDPILVKDGTSIIQTITNLNTEINNVLDNLKDTLINLKDGVAKQLDSPENIEKFVNDLLSNIKTYDNLENLMDYYGKYIKINKAISKNTMTSVDERAKHLSSALQMIYEDSNANVITAQETIDKTIKTINNEEATTTINKLITVLDSTIKTSDAQVKPIVDAIVDNIYSISNGPGKVSEFINRLDELFTFPEITYHVDLYTELRVIRQELEDLEDAAQLFFFNPTTDFGSAIKEINDICLKDLNNLLENQKLYTVLSEDISTEISDYISAALPELNKFKQTIAQFNATKLTTEELITALNTPSMVLKDWQANASILLNNFKNELSIESADKLQTLITKVQYAINDLSRNKNINEDILNNLKIIQKQIDTIKTNIATIDLAQLSLDLTAKGKLYEIKTEQVYNVMSYISNEDLTSAMHILATGQGDCAWSDVLYNIRQCVEEWKDKVSQLSSNEQRVYNACKDLVDIAKKYEAYVNLDIDLQSLVKQGHIDDRLLNAIRSTLQRYSINSTGKALTCTQIAANFDMWFHNIFLEDLRNNFREAFTRTEALNQAAFFNAYKEKGVLKKYNIKADRYTHTAKEDAAVTGVILQEELSDEFETWVAQRGLQDCKVVCIDIEANGLLDYTNLGRHSTNEIRNTPDVFEIGTVIYDNTELKNNPVSKEYLRQYGGNADVNVPDKAVLSATGDPDIPNAEKVQQWISKHNGEAEGATDYYTRFLNELLADGDNIILVSHNGQAYDMRVLCTQFEKAGVDITLVERFKKLVNTQHFDNYVALQNKLGYYTLTEDNVINIKQLLKTYIDDSVLWQDSSATAFDLGINDFLKKSQALADMSNIDHLKIPDDLTKTILNIGLDLKIKNDSVRYILNTDAIKKVYLTERGTFKSFEEISNNALHKNIIIELIQYYSKELQSTKFTKETYEKLCRILGTDPNLTTLLSRVPDSITYFGYRKLIDTDRIRNWFDLDNPSWHPTPWTMDELSELQRITYQIEYAIQSAKRNVYLNDFSSAQIIKNIQTIKAYLKNEDINYATDMFYNISMTVNNNAEALALYNIYNAKLKEVLDMKYGVEAKTTYNKFIETLPSIFTDKLLQFTETDSGLDYIIDSYREVLGELYTLREQEIYIKECDNFSAYSSALAQHNLLTPAKMAQSAALDDTIALTYAAHQILYTSEEAQMFFDRLCIYETTFVLGENNTPEKLLHYMLANKAPWIQFDYTTPNGYGLLLKPYVDSIYKNIDEYEKIGLHIVKDDNTGLVYIIRDKSTNAKYYIDQSGYHMVYKKDGVNIDEVIDYASNKDWSLANVLTDANKKRLAAQYDTLIELEKRVRQHNSILTNGLSNGHLNSRLTKKAFNRAYLQLPEAVKAILPDATDLMREDIWEYLVFDSIHLGSSSIRGLNNNYDYIARLADISANTIQHAQYNALYLDYMFNADVSIKELCNNLGTDEVLNMLLAHKDEYKIITITQSPKAKGQILFGGAGYKVAALNIIDKPSLNLVLEKCPQAILVPTSAYSEISSKLTNTLLMDNPAYKVVRSVMYAFKIGLITTVGKVFRDIVESTSKNLIETENVIALAKNSANAPQVYYSYRKAMHDILGLNAINEQGYKLMQSAGYPPEVFAELYIKNRRKAMTLLTEHCDNVLDIIKMDRNKVYTDANKKLYFKMMGDNAKISEELFDELHGLIFEHESFEAVGNKLIDFIFKPMAYTDHVMRLSEYLTLRDITTMSPIEMSAKVLSTHFDAAIKTDTELLAELFVPFYTFLKRNALYWTNAAIEHPYIARFMGDYLSRSVGNLDSYSDFELNNNTSLQSALFNGALAIGETESGDLLSLKVNVPFMAAYQMYTQPVSMLMQSTNPILQYLAHQLITNNKYVPDAVPEVLGLNRRYDFLETGNNYDFNKTQLIPLVGPILNKYLGTGYVDKQVQETNNKLLYLNSVFGRIKRFKQPEYTTYTNTQTNKKQWKPTISPAQFKYYTGQYKSYYKSKKTSVKAPSSKYNKHYNNYYQKYYPKRYTDYTYNNDSYRFYKKTWQQLQREQDYHNRVMYYKNTERQAESNKRAWRVRQAQYNALRLPKYMRTLGKTIKYRK